MIYTVIALLAMLGFASFAVDLGVVSVTRAELSTAVDAACAAGCTGLSISPAEARARAKAIASQNKVNGKPFVLLDSDIELGTWNTATGQFVLLTGAGEVGATAIRINGKLAAGRGTQVNLIFLPLVRGSSSVNLNSSCIGTSSVGSADVIVVQDVSTSFSDEIVDARDGDRALLDALKNADGNSGFGLVAFSGRGKKIADLQTVGPHYAALKSSVNSLNIAGSTGMPASTGTDIAAGIEVAQQMFDSYESEPTSTRAMVIVSDGEPSSFWFGAHWWMSSSELLALAQQDADAAWAKGIHVYVVFFNRDNNPTSAANLRSLTRGRGVFVQVADPALLPGTIGGISQRLPGRLVK